MSIFNELLPKICEISNAYTKNFNDDLKAVLDSFEKFEEEFLNARSKAREKTQKENNLTTLQSIHEDDDESTKSSDTDSTKTQSSNKSTNTKSSDNSKSSDSNSERPHRASKKRSKHEVDGMSSPEQDKRQKRNASVKASSNISKQVNVNLTQKLRREDNDKKSTSSRRRKDDDKENSEPPLNIQIKQEKISIPPEPEPTSMVVETLPIKTEAMEKDEIAMPPPVLPVPKSRAKAAAKEKPVDDVSEEETTKRRSTRTRKQTDNAPAPVPAPRSTRASSRTTKQVETEELAPPPEPRPKRTRAKKKVSDVPPEPEKENESTQQENGLASPAEKPRPKRTRRAQKAAEKEEVKKETPQPIESPKEKRKSRQRISSPIISLPLKEKKQGEKGKIDIVSETIGSSADETDCLDKTRVIGNANDMDKTMVLPNGVYNHAPVTPKNIRKMNETVVLEANTRETIVLDKPKNAIMDATVVLDKEPVTSNLTDDNSLLTDDSDANNVDTPPKQEPPKIQPTSAVKEKVQQFEEMATRVTRTKTRAMAKKEDDTETHTPPDKIVKAGLSMDTLNKMNNMIFNGKQISSSASKPRSNIPTAKPLAPASTSKLAGISRAKEEADAKRAKEDARMKKEALLDAKRELQKKKREEKMAAAAAAREAAERERRAAMEAAARERMEKQAHADMGKMERLKEAERRERRAAMEAAARERMEKQAHADMGKMERLKEAERKKQELARKVAETEERRRAEEQARQQRLAEEQRRADEARRKQLEEAAAMKKEAVLMAKEIEKKQKEYIEKQKMKQRMEEKNHTPLKGGGSTYHGSALEPAYMQDGFQYLNSDEDEEPVDRPVPDWSTAKARKLRLHIQSQVSQSHVDRLFSVRVHSPDLRDIFPNIERARLKRTSSAVWRTPPAARLPALAE